MESTKHRLLSALAVAAAVALPAGVAHAAAKPTVKPTTITGVVVAREQARGTLVVASSRGAVETLRTRAADRVGTLVTAKATRLADGTYRGSSVRRSGVARHARVHGVVVSAAKGRILLSAGGSVFGIDRSRVVSAVGGSGTLQTGDVVDASVSIDPTSGSVQEQSVQQVGQASLVQLEGTIQSLAAGQLVLAVEHGAVTTVAIPSSLTLPSTIAVGDSVELLAQFASGTFTLVTIQDDHAAALATGGGATTSSSSSSSSGSEDSQAEIEAEGLVTAVSSTSLTVQGKEASPVTFVVPSGFDVSAVKVGDRVHAKGTLAAAGAITLVKLEVQNPGEGEHKSGGQQSAEVEAEGSVTAVSSTSLTVQPGNGGTSVTFTVPAGFDVSAVKVGDQVDAKGTKNADGSVTLVKLEDKTSGANTASGTSGGSSGGSGGGDSSGSDSGNG